MQEALTNVIRHADASVVEVVVRYLDRSVEIVITDDGRGALPTSEGFGLHGMQQRVDLLGGEITAANRREGGFAVRAVLPVSQEALVPGAGR